MAKGKLKDFIFPLLVAVIPTLVVWMPFVFRLKSFWHIPLPQQGMATIVSNYDGPLYMVVAKTLYNKELIGNLFPFPLPTEYYAAHFPAFPLLIRLFSPLLGLPYSMLAITVFSSFLATYFFYLFVKERSNEVDARWLTMLFSILPARWLIVRSVGSAEPLFIASTIASIYYFDKRKYVKAGLWGALAQLTKSVGILLFLAYLLSIIFPNLNKAATSNVKTWLNKVSLGKKLPLLLIPLSLFLLFIFFGIYWKDFFAYFHSGDNIHLFFPPFQVFNYSAPWVGTFWLEEIVLIYLIGSLGLIKLIEKKESLLAWFVGIFFFSLIFVSHRDVMRYTLPITPFIIYSFSDTLNKKSFRIVMAIIIIPIYLFSLAYISQNVMPIADWSPFL